MPVCQPGPDVSGAMRGAVGSGFVSPIFSAAATASGFDVSTPATSTTGSGSFTVIVRCDVCCSVSAVEETSDTACAPVSILELGSSWDSAAFVLCSAPRPMVSVDTGSEPCAVFNVTKLAMQSATTMASTMGTLPCIVLFFVPVKDNTNLHRRSGIPYRTLQLWCD